MPHRNGSFVCIWSERNSSNKSGSTRHEFKSVLLKKSFQYKLCNNKIKTLHFKLYNL